ncbi:nucleoside triphosphate pyrophosphohydrolase [Leptospira sp. GIMC2001]|uniref:nucleoside triphosphate pyrophosphohydrolase n=1 Tax=Leptospira sp. GIMC2001 TaxID=1513297 RepID=UPI00234AD8E5|nr:nucleoside triphosphate pyrophosphohydrolase [Leptospira sp. GIMC2001]WCL50102.1 nucleoside triphosphate pyrophosphohydrolase [Leptospira sp. GIMC2001]
MIFLDIGECMQDYANQNWELSDICNKKDSIHSMDRLRKIMEILRSENGCPWDKVQTHDSLIPCLLEESYEVVDAIEMNDFVGIKEELGDLLFQSVFHARLAEEQNLFSIDDVIHGIADKLVRRHPHVFASTQGVDSPEQVVTQWEAIKLEEKRMKAEERKKIDGRLRSLESDATSELLLSHINEPTLDSILDSVPSALPAIQKADKIQSKVSKVGFDWEKWQEPIEKLWEEVSELKNELDHLKNFHSNSSDAKIKIKDLPSDLIGRIESEMGDVLFSIVNVARHLKLDAETSLRKTNEKFSKRFRYIERASSEMGKSLNDMNLKEMDELWNQAKKLESKLV